MTGLGVSRAEAQRRLTSPASFPISSHSPPNTKHLGSTAPTHQQPASSRLAPKSGLHHTENTPHAMARSIAPSRRGGGGGGGRHSNSLLLPFALTLTTAAIASAGLYFFSDTSNNTSPSRPYLPSDTEEERDQHQPRRSRKPPRTKTAILRREDREADILSGFSDIPEEDTDAIVESRREEEEHRRRKRGSLRGTKAGSMLAYMKGAAVEALEKMNDDGLYDEEEALKIKQIKEEVDKERRQQELARLQRIEQQQQLEQLAREAAQIPLPSDSPPTASGAGAAALAISSEQYKPIAKRLKHIALVVKERKALHGHDSDSDFEEAMLPNVSSLLRPLSCQSPIPTYPALACHV